MTSAVTQLQEDIFRQQPLPLGEMTNARVVKRVIHLHDFLKKVSFFNEEAVVRLENQFCATVDRNLMLLSKNPAAHQKMCQNGNDASLLQQLERLKSSYPKRFSTSIDKAVAEVIARIQQAAQEEEKQKQLKARQEEVRKDKEAAERRRVAAVREQQKQRERDRQAQAALEVARRDMEQRQRELAAARRAETAAREEAAEIQRQQEEQQQQQVCVVMTPFGPALVQISNNGYGGHGGFGHHGGGYIGGGGYFGGGGYYGGGGFF